MANDDVQVQTSTTSTDSHPKRTTVTKWDSASRCCRGGELGCNHQGKPRGGSRGAADLLILILGHSLAMEVDQRRVPQKMDRVMTRKARTGKLGYRVTINNNDTNEPKQFGEKIPGL